MTHLRIHSTPLIYSIGLFRWIEEAIMPFDGDQARTLLEGLGINPDLIGPIIEGRYAKETDGETLILKIVD